MNVGVRDPPCGDRDTVGQVFRSSEVGAWRRGELEERGRETKE
jgi:hypothetical protein